MSTVVGCRESRDRIEFAIYLKEFVARDDAKEKEGGKGEDDQAKEPYKIVLSAGAKKFIRMATVRQLALIFPKYDLITPSLASILMKELRGMLCHKELLEVLQEKEDEKTLPFDALRDLCLRFKTPLSDEQCAFVTASFITELNKGTILINFKEFLAELKEGPVGKIENLDLMRSKGLSISESINSDDSKDSAEMKL